MLADDVKGRIQAAYSQMLNSYDLVPRYGQRLMIAEIAKALAQLVDEDHENTPICAIEAGTGTGKTLAYLLASIPLAKEMGFQVVVATATVALQEQVILKDIPELLQGTDLDFSFALAKGRGRYVCLSKLDAHLSGSDSSQAMLELYGEEVDDLQGGNHALYQEMLDALSAGNWQGDRDDWPKIVSDRDWQPLTVDNAGCLGSRCSNFSNCCFYRARDSMDKADCIISNHDLVLSDLALGGGVILPDPGKCIYIFDEAHHLPLKSNNHFARYSPVKATMTWLERLQNMSRGLLQDEFIQPDEQEALESLLTTTGKQLQQTYYILLDMVNEQSSEQHYENRRQLTFKSGIVPEAILLEADNLAGYFTQLTTRWQKINEQLKAELEESSSVDHSERAEQWFPLVGASAKRAEANMELWLAFSQPDIVGKAPMARWISASIDETEELHMSATPVLAADNLQQRLWESCAAAVLTSATLTSLDSFEMLIMRAGLPEHTQFLRIPSPFRFAEAATISVPRLNCDPSDNLRHTELIVAAIPKLLATTDAALMLFSSRRQMRDVLDGLDDEWRDRVLCQDDFQKSQLLKYHRKRVDDGEGSIIFGLASFAEGIDLPSKYCTHVLIAKLPFSVPNDPVEVTLADWVEEQGHNPFMKLAVPDAAFRLLQATGRLLRNEQDTGQITLFDERIVTRRYGKAILDSLPPYRRELLTLDLSESLADSA